MHILIHTLTGKKFDLNVEGISKISTINSEIESQMGIPVESQKLIANGKKLDSSMVISDITTSDEMNVYLVIDLEGGAKGKKKKKMVKKNKKPHKHRKNKLAILSYYKVEEDTVVRLRQQCKLCPPGNSYNKINKRNLFS
jgi:small subunit ribosomal protein S27Ae